MTVQTTKSERLDLRITSDQKRLLESAAVEAGTTLTDFVVTAAAIAARATMADRTQFSLPPDRWAAFAAALDREPVELPRLGALLREPRADEA
jgi:uncharacterized protein (DUF1778 family)